MYFSCGLHGKFVTIASDYDNFFVFPSSYRNTIFNQSAQLNVASETTEGTLWKTSHDRQRRHQAEAMQKSSIPSQGNWQVTETSQTDLSETSREFLTDQEVQ